MSTIGTPASAAYTDEAFLLTKSGRAELALDAISSRLSTLPQLGTYRINVVGTAATGDAGITLSTTEGPLQLSGSGQWAASRLRFRGEARAAEGFDAVLIEREQSPNQWEDWRFRIADVVPDTFAFGWTRTATDPALFQAPFRAGIRIDPYQLEPLRKALRLPRVNLFIADDVGEEIK